jgi:hypothetical protein
LVTLRVKEVARQLPFEFFLKLLYLKTTLLNKYFFSFPNVFAIAHVHIHVNLLPHSISASFSFPSPFSHFPPFASSSSAFYVNPSFSFTRCFAPMFAQQFQSVGRWRQSSCALMAVEKRRRMKAGEAHKTSGPCAKGVPRQFTCQPLSMSGGQPLVSPNLGSFRLLCLTPSLSGGRSTAPEKMLTTGRHHKIDRRQW